MNENRKIVIGKNDIGFENDTVLTPCMSTALLEAIIDTSKHYSQKANDQWVFGARYMRLDEIIHGHFYHAISCALAAVLQTLPHSSEEGGYACAKIDVANLQNHLPVLPDLSPLLKAMK